MTQINGLDCSLFYDKQLDGLDRCLLKDYFFQMKIVIAFFSQKVRFDSESFLLPRLVYKVTYY